MTSPLTQSRLVLVAGASVMLAIASGASAQGTQNAKPAMEIYGFAQLDAGYDVMQNDPSWYDVNRPTKLPSFPGEFGKDGRTYFSARQSRFGVKGDVPTDSGRVQTTFEFDLFGVGADAGQTTIRLRHASGQYGAFGGGQTYSPFMDVDVFPNSLDYWGPSGMLFFRNVLAFWQPIRGANRLTLAVEKPGASGDGGVYADRVALQNVQLRFPLPDFSAEYRLGRQWGYVETAGIVRRITYDDLAADSFDLDGSSTGWGVSVSSNVKPGKADVLRLQLVYGAGIENYFNDAPVDVAPENNFGNPRTPILGTALPVLGLTAFLDHDWNDRWSTSGGYSLVNIDNSDGQEASAFKRGQYMLVNLLHRPANDVMVGGELQWARRDNATDGFSVDDVRIQFSLKFSFSGRLAGP